MSLFHALLLTLAVLGASTGAVLLLARVFARAFGYDWKA
jgi:hypothetical protein